MIYTVNVWDKMEAEKYLRKNCYHRIKYSAANSLAAFMWKAMIIQREIYNVRDS